MSAVTPIKPPSSPGDQKLAALRYACAGLQLAMSTVSAVAGAIESVEASECNGFEDVLRAHVESPISAAIEAMRAILLSDGDGATAEPPAA